MTLVTAEVWKDDHDRSETPVVLPGRDGARRGATGAQERQAARALDPGQVALRSTGPWTLDEAAQLQQTQDATQDGGRLLHGHARRTIRCRYPCAD